MQKLVEDFVDQCQEKGFDPQVEMVAVWIRSVEINKPINEVLVEWPKEHLDRKRRSYRNISKAIPDEAKEIILYGCISGEAVQK